VGTLIHPDPPAPVVYASIGSRFGSRLTAAEVAPRFRAAFAREEVIDRAQSLRTSEEREVRRWRDIVATVFGDGIDLPGCFEALFAHFARPDAWRCEPEVGLTLRELARRSYVLGMASNYDRRLRSVVAGLAELTPLEHLVISSEVSWRKPAAEFFHALVVAAGVAPGEIVFVGDDRANDYDGAISYGLSAVWFDPTDREPSFPGERITHLTQLLSCAES
jgi:putative hydrolase of the HAD superfamily